MKKENIKTDDSVKAGMKIEGGHQSNNSTDSRGGAEDKDAAISPEERELLNTSGKTGEDDERLRTGRLDNKDSDGDLLNVSSSADDETGRDLDIPGAEDDDDMEDIGEEDEENNPYSLSDNSD
jgi:hypothetical protein